MKTKTLLRSIIFLLIMQNSKNSFSQGSKEFFDSETAKTTWLGIDFTEVRVMGVIDASPSEMKDRYFESINDVVISEPKKYNLSGAFHKNDVATDLTLVNKQNSKIEADKIKTSNSADLSRLNPEMINKIVKNYDFGDKKGFGILFVMEGMSKTAVEASMYVTIIDMEKKNVVYTKRMVSKPRGFGFRNFWAFTVSEVLKDIEKSEYKKMKAEAK